MDHWSYAAGLFLTFLCSYVNYWFCPVYLPLIALSSCNYNQVTLFCSLVYFLSGLGNNHDHEKLAHWPQPLCQSVSSVPWEFDGASVHVGVHWEETAQHNIKVKASDIRRKNLWCILAYMINVSVCLCVYALQGLLDSYRLLFLSCLSPPSHLYSVASLLLWVVMQPFQWQASFSFNGVCVADNNFIIFSCRCNWMNICTYANAKEYKQTEIMGFQIIHDLYFENTAVTNSWGLKSLWCFCMWRDWERGAGFNFGKLSSIGMQHNLELMTRREITEISL